MQRRILFTSSIGNILEFYDFALYGFLVPILAPLFFPVSNPIAALISAYGVFALSFMVRPLGGYFFGRIGDLYGRRFALSLTILLMGSSCIGISLLPTYQQIGIIAPSLLILLRLIQGFCIGAEFNCSLTYVSEYFANTKYKGSSTPTSFATAAGLLGWFLAAFSSWAILKNPFFGDSSWRILFFFGGIVAVIGFYIRYYLPETFSPTHQNDEHDSAIKAPFLLVAVFGAYIGVVFYGQFICLNSYLPLVVRVSTSDVNLSTTLGIFSYMIFIVPASLLTNKIGIRKTLIISLWLMLLLSYPLFLLVLSEKLIFMIITCVSMGILLAGFMAPASWIMPNLFPKRSRLRRFSLSYNLGNCLLGGITPALTIYILHTFCIESSLIVYHLFITSLTLISTLLLLKYK